MSNFTSALKLENDLHITLCFCPAENKKGKVSTWSGISTALVVSVEYWENVDVTVLIMQSDLAHERHEYYKENGYTYGYEFKPHATVSKGDTKKEHQHLIGSEIKIIGEYVRVF